MGQFSKLRVVFDIINWFIVGLAALYMLHIPQLSHHFLVRDDSYKKELKSLEALYINRKAFGENSEMQFTDIFAVPQDLKWKKRKLKEIHDFIFTTLDRLQTEGDCKTKKIIRCQNSYGSGLGSMVHRYVICLHIAFALNRMFFIQQPEFKNFNGLGEFTKLDETNCPHLATELHTIEDRCDFKNYDCYIDKGGLEINNTYRLLEFTREANFPAPKYIPRTIPREMEKALTIIGVLKPWHWFTAQLLGYLMMRPNKRFKERFKKEIDENGLHHPIAGIHFRRGDKINAEARLISEKLYINKVEDLFNLRMKSAKRRYVYVASDDRRAMKITKKLFNSSYVVATPGTINDIRISSKRRDDFARSTMENMLIDLYFLVHCDFAVVTFSSNIGRLVWELRTSQFPYLEADNTVISMDSAMFYGWYDYSSVLPYQLATNTNNQTVELGKDKIIPYAKGQLFIVWKTKTLLASNGEKVKLKFGRLRGAKVNTEGYLYADHFVNWPGDAVYINDISL